MREFNVCQSYHDNDGELLHGRITFYNREGTEKINIYNEAGAVITNPMLTNSIGQTEQEVFLGDCDYKVVFEKYSGSGEFDDPSSWIFQYSCIDLYDTINIKVDAKGLQTVNTIADLRHTDPVTIAEQTDKRLVALVGYYEAGDKPQVIYVWDEEDNETPDDGGSCIKVAGIEQGRWKFSPDQFEKYDVRHWGAFPAAAMNQLTLDQRYAIQQAVNFAGLNNEIIYFPADALNKYYAISQNINRASFNVSAQIAVPNNQTVSVHVVDNSDLIKVSQNDDYKGTLKLYGDILKTDCITAVQSTKDATKVQFYPKYKLILSGDVNGATYNGIDVIFDGNVNVVSGSLTINDCELSGKVLNAATMTIVNCYVSESMFSDITNISFSNCRSSIKEWGSDVNFFNYSQKNGDKVLDYEGRSITQDVWWKNDGDITLMNIGPSSSEIRFTGAGKKVFQNVIASNIRASETDNNLSFIVKNSDVKVANLNNQRLKDIVVEDSKFEMNRQTVSVIWPESITLFNSTFISTSEIRPSSLDTSKQAFINAANSEIKCNLNLYQSNSSTFYGCILRNKIDCYSIEVDNCDIYNQINSVNKPDSVYLTFAITNNRFRSGSNHNVSGTLVSEQKVRLSNAKWIGNVSYSGMFVQLDRTNLHPTESMHDYIYENNTGTSVLQKGCKINLNITMRNGAAVEGEHNTVYYSTYTGNSSLSGYYGPAALTATTPPTTDTSKYITTLSFFSVGTTGLEFKGTGIGRLSTNSAAATGSPIIATTGYVTSTEWIPYPQAVGGTNYAKDIWFNSGYNWTFRGFRNAPIVTVPYPLGNNAVLPMTIELERI